MLNNWIKQATPTTDAGDIALGTVATGFIGVADGFVDQDDLFYSIQDGNDRETGVGKYDLAGNKVIRTVVFETLVSGAYVKGDAASAITLSGNAVLQVTAISESIPDGALLEPAIMDPVDSMLIPDNWHNMDSQYDFAIDDMLFTIPAILYYPRKISKWAFEVQVDDSGQGNLRFGIYTTANNGKPDRLIIDSGDLSAQVASTGFKTVTLPTPLYLGAGHYHFALVSADGTIEFPSPSMTDGIGGGFSQIVGGVRNSWAQAGVTGALPDPFVSSGFEELDFPKFGWQ